MGTFGGLLVRGVIFPVEGLTIWNPTNAPWCKLDPGDYRLRRPGEFVHMVVPHTTKGIWPQYVRPGVGPASRDQLVAGFWRGDPEHSAAQMVVGSGEAACLCDLATVAAYHATASNPWSVGIEMYQEGDGSIYEATYQTMVPLVFALANIFGFPVVMPKLPYANKPLDRMIHGGEDVYGVMGHRENTSRRGRGDPGDELYVRLEHAGGERFDIDAREDIAVAKRRQGFLNATHGEKLVVDGRPGPATMAAVKKHGYKLWRDVPA